MKKKTLAILSAVMVLAMSSMTVFAAEPLSEPDPDQKASTAMAATTATPEEYAANTTVAGGYTVSALSQQTFDEAKAALQGIFLYSLSFFYVSDDSDYPAMMELSDISKDPSTLVTATVLSAVTLDGSSANTNTLTFNVPGISAGDKIVIMYTEPGYGWEVLTYATATANNSFTSKTWEIFQEPITYLIAKVTFSEAGAAPAPAVETPAAEEPAAVETPVTEVPAADEAAVEAPVEAPAADAATASPETGEAVPMAAVIIMVGLTGAVICGKKILA